MTDLIQLTREPRHPELSELMARMRSDLSERGPMVVAVSGGVDSALVWAVAHEVLGDGALGVTAVSPSLARRERTEVEALVAEVGGRHRFVETAELEDPNYASNPTDRCYFCKVALWDALSAVAAEEGVGTLTDGLNADDLSTHRPGHRAGREYSVFSPLAEHGFTKADVRAAAKDLGLRCWDKPAMACLSSRFAYGVVIDKSRLGRVDRAEALLRSLGLTDPLRVRVHGEDLVRIEVRPEEFGRLISVRKRVIEGFRDLGFVYVGLDLAGFRSGSMNRGVDLDG